MNFIDGVTLLNTTVIDHSTFYSMLGPVSFCLSLTAIIYGIFLLADHGFFTKASIVSIIIGFLFMLTFVDSLVMDSKFPYTLYEVTVDDNVSFNEFCNTYEIVEQSGKIITVRAKETEQNNDQ